MQPLSLASSTPDNVSVSSVLVEPHLSLNLSGGMEEGSRNIASNETSCKSGWIAQTRGASGKGGKGLSWLVLGFVIFFEVRGRVLRAKNKEESKILNIP